MLKLIIFVFFMLFLSACAQKAPQIVYIPTKCDVPKREKPAKEANPLLYLKQVLIYTEGLERDLSFCRGENTQN